jgi:hypothetical protein
VAKAVLLSAVPPIHAPDACESRRTTPSVKTVLTRRLPRWASS